MSYNEKHGKLEMRAVEDGIWVSDLEKYGKWEIQCVVHVI